MIEEWIENELVSNVVDIEQKLKELVDDAEYLEYDKSEIGILLLKAKLIIEEIKIRIKENTK